MVDERTSLLEVSPEQESSPAQLLQIARSRRAAARSVRSRRDFVVLGSGIAATMGAAAIGKVGASGIEIARSLLEPPVPAVTQQIMQTQPDNEYPQETSVIKDAGKIDCVRLALPDTRYNPQEKEFVQNMATKYEGNYSDENVEKVLTYEKDIQNAVKELARAGISIDPTIVALFPSLILVESKGNPKAVAGHTLLPFALIPEQHKRTRAVGLCQMLPATAEEVGEKIRNAGVEVPFTEVTIPSPTPEKTEKKAIYNLFDPRTSLLFGLTHLQNTYNHTPDPLLAFWEYHAGFGNMDKFVNAYLSEQDDDQKKEKIVEIKQAAKTPYLASVGLVKETALGINYASLYESKSVKEIYKTLADDTQHYPARIVAAMRRLDKVRTVQNVANRQTT